MELIENNGKESEYYKNMVYMGPIKIKLLFIDPELSVSLLDFVL